MVDSVMPYYLFKACIKCHGDLINDDKDWRCVQCATYYYPSIINEEYPKRSNALPISNKDDLFLERNKDVIKNIKLDFSIQEIADLTGLNYRWVRSISDQYKDILKYKDSEC